MQNPEEQKTSVSIPVLPEAPEAKESRGWLVLLFFSSFLVLSIFLLMGTSGTSNPTPPTPPLPNQAITNNRLVTLHIEAEPKAALVQVSASSLDQRVEANGDIKVELSPGEEVSFTVSLDGYRTVYGRLFAQEDTQSIQLQPLQPSQPLPAPTRVAAAPKKPPQNSSAPIAQASGCSQ